MKILALEFSSRQRSVAVLQAGTMTQSGLGAAMSARSQMSLSEVTEAGGLAANTFGMIDSALRDAGVEREQIELLVIGLGPGSYSGIRRAIAAAQGWQLARGTEKLKLLGIGSVDALVAQAERDRVAGEFNVVID